MPARMKGLASRAAAIEASATVALSNLVAELRAKGEDIVSLTAGEPDFPTPSHIIQAAKAALDEGYTRYTSSLGIKELREAIAEKSRRENNIPADASNILVTPAKMAIFIACMAVIDEGDEVIVPDPGWVSYSPIVSLAGGRPVPVDASEDRGFRLTPEAVSEATTPRTKMIILNSPSNPGGGVASLEDIKGLGELAEDEDLYLLSDEIYEKILYSGKHHSPASLPGLFERVLTVNGFSKTYAMTGWRLGWIVASRQLVAEMTKVQEHSLTCATSFAQKGGIAALKGPQNDVARMVSEFEARRDMLMRGLSGIDGVSCFEPQGAFYAFSRFDWGMNSVELSQFLLKQVGFAATPGSSFGERGEYHLRLSFAASRETISKALERLEEAERKRRKV